MLSVEQAHQKYIAEVHNAGLFIKSNIDFRASFEGLDDRRKELRVAAQQAEAKLDKFSDYLIQKVEKRKQEVKQLIADRLSTEMAALT